MNKVNKLKISASYFIQCYNLAIKYTGSSLNQLQIYPIRFNNIVNEQEWKVAYRSIDLSIRECKNFTKKNPQYIEDCSLLITQLSMIKHGMKIILKEEFGLKPCVHDAEKTVFEHI